MSERRESNGTQHYSLMFLDTRIWGYDKWTRWLYMVGRLEFRFVKYIRFYSINMMAREKAALTLNYNIL